MKHQQSSILIASLLSLAFLGGCAGSSGADRTGLVPQAAYSLPAPTVANAGPRAATIYFGAVTLANQPEIGRYPATATGNVAPSHVITGSNTHLVTPDEIFADKSGNVWVCDYDGQAIDEFTVNQAGNVAPAVSIAGSNVKFTGCTGIAIDAIGRILTVDYTANAIYAWPAGSHGNVAPAVTIAGAATHLNHPIGIGVDSARNLYVTNEGSNSITEYAAAAHGNAAPMRTIAGSNTLLASPHGIALAGGLILTSDTYGNRLAAFAMSATGNAAPVASLYGNKTGLDDPFGVAVDAAGYVYAANAPQVPLNPVGFISVFKPGSTGNFAPVQTIEGPLANFKYVQSVYVR